MADMVSLGCVCRTDSHLCCVFSVMKMGNIVPRAGFKPTYISGIRASVVPLHCLGSIMSPV